MQGKKEQRKKRRARVRARVRGSAQVPRLAVFRSNRRIYAQIINDDRGETLASSCASSFGAAASSAGESALPRERAALVGRELAKKAKAKKITRVVFDRGGFDYSGSVRALAEGARDGGLEF